MSEVSKSIDIYIILVHLLLCQLGRRKLSKYPSNR